MKHSSRCLAPLLALSLLASCAPQATTAAPDNQILKFLELPSYNLAVVANAPIEYGDVLVAGYELAIESEHCAVPDCVPAPDGYVRLTFDDEPEANYGRRIEIQVTGGTPIKGRAMMTLQNENVTRPAVLQLWTAP